MLELGEEEIIHLLDELKIAGAYDYIIVDCKFDLDKRTTEILKQAHYIVWVCDGSESTNSKMIRAYNALIIKEQSADIRLLDRICLVYNKFSNKTSQTIDEVSVRNVGGAPRFEQATTEQIVNKLATMQIFSEIVK